MSLVNDCMKKGKEITIYDIAKQLNISASTVSRALQDHPGVNKKTKKMIADFVAQTSFRTNPFASNLRNKQTQTIGVLVHALNSNFVTSVLAGIEKVTAAEGFDILIAHSSESAVKEAANVKNLFNKRVDGLIASLSFDTTNLEHFRPFFDRGVPVLFFDRVEQDGNKTVVIIDNAKCGYIATQHLIEQGCRRIAHVTYALNRNVYSQRYQGYCDALFDHGLPLDESLLIVQEPGRNAGLVAAEKILNMNPRPDGAFITNDFTAAVCMRALRENGVEVPADIAIVGFNNDVIGELIEPALTTINYPGEDMGEIAARNLINHIKGIGNLEQTNTIVVRSGLIVRASSLRTGRPGKLI